mgnify:CR=1 FL=1
MSLRLKFNLAILFALIVAYVATGVAVYSILQRNAKDTVLETARVMREGAQAARAYTMEEVTPLLQQLPVERFLPQTVPSFAAHMTLRKVRDAYPEYAYKEAMLNPTNPADRATDWETDVIMTFRGDGGLGELVTERVAPVGQFLVLAKPIRITDEACLRCHSVPARAPASMLALYGESNGFGWKLDEVIGAQVVSIPMSLPLAQARETFMIVMAALGGVFLLIIVIVNILLSLAVVRPVKRLSAIANEVSMGKLDAPEQ